MKSAHDRSEFHTFQRKDDCYDSICLARGVGVEQDKAKQQKGK